MDSYGAIAFGILCAIPLALFVAWVGYQFAVNGYVLPEMKYQNVRQDPDNQAWFQSIIDDLQSLPMAMDEAAYDGFPRPLDPPEGDLSYFRNCVKYFLLQERPKEAIRILKRKGKYKEYDLTHGYSLGMWLDVDLINNGVPYTEEQLKIGRAEHIFRQEYAVDKRRWSPYPPQEQFKRDSNSAMPDWFFHTLRDIREREARKVIRDPKNIEKIAQVVCNVRNCPLTPEIIAECTHRNWEPDPLTYLYRRDFNAPFCYPTIRQSRIEEVQECLGKRLRLYNYTKEQIKERLELHTVYAFAYQCVDEAYPTLAKHLNGLCQDV